MSYAPQTLLDARAYILAHTNLSPAEVGIVGDKSHTYGYHLGKDRLPANDYSRVTARDRAGLSNAASALDIGDFGDLWRLTEHLVHEARNGRLPDVREILGPLRDGRAYRWDHLDGWKAVRQAQGNSHEWHLHISYYRDSEHRDKTAPFRRFFEGTGGSGGGEMEDDVDLKDKLRTPDWARQRWSDLPETITVETALASGYSHARSGKDETYRQTAMLQAILAAVTDDDVVAAVKAELAKHDQAVAKRLGEIAALVAKVGTVPAEQIVDEIARRLAEAG